MRVLPLPLIALSACAASGRDDGDGSRITRAIAVPGAFDGVELGGPDDVRVVTGQAASISAQGRAEDLDKLDIHMKGNTLVVTRKRENWGGMMRWGRDHGITVTVTTPRPLAAARLGGSGNLDVDRGAGSAFSAALAGSGNLAVGAVDAGTVSLDLSGSGDLKVGGRARSVAVDLAGSGGVEAGTLTAQTAVIDLAGSGEVDVHASSSARVSLRGSGDVTVRGTGNCTIEKKGSGEVRCAP